MPARRVHAQRPSLHAHLVGTFVKCNVTREYIGRQYTSTKYVNHRVHANATGVTLQWERRRHNINNIQRSRIFICNCTLLTRDQCRLIALQLILALRPDGLSCTHTHTRSRMDGSGSIFWFFVNFRTTFTTLHTMHYERSITRHCLVRFHSSRVFAFHTHSIPSYWNRPEKFYRIVVRAVPVGEYLSVSVRMRND